jgi:hypothetical protein
VGGEAEAFRAMLKTLPAALALLLLAAHFLRSGGLLFVFACLALLPVCFVRAAWAGIAVRSALIAGVVIWSATAWKIAGVRAAAGESATRAMLILGGVAAFTAFAAWLLPGAEPECGER